MPYQLNKTDGTLLTTLIDGKADTESTNLTFFGKNYKGFGEGLNENFIKLLETFANSTAPNKPIRGQLWYDTATGRLKVYDGTVFRSTDSSIISDTQPDLVEGDLWIDNRNKQLYFYDGNDLTLVGPPPKASEGKTGQYVTVYQDQQGNNKTVIEEFVNDSRVAIISKEEFTPFPTINGFTTIKVGYNPSSVFDFRFLGTASNSLKLSDEQGNVYTKDSFLSAVADDTTTGVIHFRNDLGIIIGNDQDHKIRMSGTTVLQENQIVDSDWTLQVKNTDGSYNALVVDASEKRLGIMTDTPAYTLDVTGDARFTGNLIVEGETTSLDVSTLRVEDKQIELAITDDSTLILEADADDAGVVVRVSGDDKKWTWRNTADAWSSSTNIDVPQGKAYKIDGFDVLTKSALGSSVTTASGLTTIGTLNNLQVDAININGSTITETSGGIQLDSQGGPVNLTTSERITNLAAPTGNLDAANKQYVDTVATEVDIVMGLDITGLGTGATLQTNVATVLEELVAANTKANGTLAKIHATTLSASTDAITFQDSDSGGSGYINKTFVSVDKNGVENQSVVQDFSIGNASTTVTFTVSRQILTYEVSAGSWTYVSTVASAV